MQTSALPLGYAAIWSGRRDSNPRPSPWQGDALPLSHFRLIINCWCPEAESNHRHEDFQSSALPTELSGQIFDRSFETTIIIYNIILKLSIDLWALLLVIIKKPPFLIGTGINRLILLGLPLKNYIFYYRNGILLLPFRPLRLFYLSLLFLSLSVLPLSCPYYNCI